MDSAARVVWLTWNDLPWLSRSHPQSGLVHFCDQVAVRALSAGDENELLKDCLTDAGAELAAEWAGVLERADHWQVRLSVGRSAPDPLPAQYLADALDRNAACFMPAQGDDPRAVVLAPIDNRNVLCIAGRSLLADHLSAVVTMGHALSRGLDEVRQRMLMSSRIERARSTVETARRFALERATQPLLERMAEEATRLFDCERASIFIWDRNSRQLVACPALGVDGGQLWLPDNKGIVGQVVQNGDTLRVDDAG